MAACRGWSAWRRHDNDEGPSPYCTDGNQSTTIPNFANANLDAFMQVSIPVDFREASAIDHVYVIVRGQLVEL